MKSVAVSLITFQKHENRLKILESLENQSHEPEVVYWRDHSTTIIDSLDDSLLGKNRSFELNFERTANLGFGIGHNRNIEKITQDFVLILNDDALIEENYIEECLKSFESTEAKLAGVTGALWEVSSIDASEKFKPDLDLFRINSFRKTSPSKGDQIKANTLGGVTCVAALFPTPLLMKFPFDGAYFMYFEDVDLAWRLSNAGYEFRRVRSTNAYHERSYRFGKRQSVPVELRKRVWSNRYRSIRKNETMLSFLIRLPMLLGYELVQFTFAVLFDRKMLEIYWKSPSQVSR